MKRRVFIALLAFGWAASIGGAALLTNASTFQRPSARTATQVPAPVSFHDARGRGLLVDVWIAKTGPYVFAVDTGAGYTVVRSDVLRRAGLTATSGRGARVGGLAAGGTVLTQQTVLNDLAIGTADNLLQSHHKALVVSTLPEGLDGILDPTEAYAPLGYVIDLPNRQLLPFDTKTSRLRTGTEPAGGTIVPWVRESANKRPFVRLGDNRLALIDTGSSFGLALTYDAIVSAGKRNSDRPIHDLGGGTLKSRRVAPVTVSIGSLVLQKVPTDVLVGSHENAPVILGREALYPFRITFDPASLLIEIVPAVRNSRG